MVCDRPATVCSVRASGGPGTTRGASNCPLSSENGQSKALVNSCSRSLRSGSSDAQHPWRSRSSGRSHRRRCALKCGHPRCLVCQATSATGKHADHPPTRRTRWSLETPRFRPISRAVEVAQHDRSSSVPRSASTPQPLPANTSRINSRQDPLAGSQNRPSLRNLVHPATTTNGRLGPAQAEVAAP